MSGGRPSAAGADGRMRVLIVRTSAIGDVVFASAFAEALRRAHPQAYIAWLVEPGIDELLHGDPALDEVIVWPKAQWRALWRAGQRLALWREVRAFRRQLRLRQFDVAYDLQGLAKSGLLAWISGARRRIGLGSKEGSQWLMHEVVERGGDRRLISSEYRHLAQHLGLPVDGFLPRLHVSAQADAQWQQRLAGLGLAPAGYVALAPFTTRPQKHWTVAAWRELAQQLLRRGLVPVVLGGPGDVEAAEEIATADPRIVSVAGQTRLPEAVAAIRHAALLVGVDTGLTHMASAVDTPTVALFGSTCPYLDNGRPTGRVLWLAKPCSPCRRRPTCGGSFHCMTDITPQQVIDTATHLLPERFLVR